ncbi:MAG: HdeD family acid-resistance protein [Candidatus Berkiellales bacterium]
MLRFEKNNQPLKSLNKSWPWLLVLGFLLILLGSLAIFAATFTTLISVIFLGAIFLAVGVMTIIDSFSNWKGSALFYHFGFGVLYSLLGLMCLLGPVGAAISLTLLLGVFFIVVGVFRIFFAISLHLPTWGWALFSGLMSLLLGMLILMQWPVSGLFIIGLFVGIDLIFIGWAYVMISLFVRKLVVER